MMNVKILLLIFTISSAFDPFSGPKRALWRTISDKAREGIVARTELIGVDWKGK